MSVPIKRTVRSFQIGRSRNQSRAAGDKARNERDWKTAEIEYRAHLDMVPQDQPIWIQYGHCLKEQSKLIEAEAAYRHAIDLDPDDADAHLQLGHSLKLLDRLSLAEQAYKRSFELRPSKAAYDEMIRLADVDEVPERLPTRRDHDLLETIYLEVDDLLDYLRHYRTLSGIQRVQVGIIQHAIKEITSSGQPYAFVRMGKHAAVFWRLDPNDLLSLLDYVSQKVVSQQQLLSLVEFAEQHASLVDPLAGQTYFVLGAFWGFGANATRYARLKAAGVSVGVYIYDLIPVTHPEYCTAGLVSEFSFSLGDGLYSFDFILTISEFVARDVRRFQEAHRLRHVPVEAVRLAHQLHDRPSLPANSRWTGDISILERRPFVLMVSTIEARKNHVYLYSVWKALIEEGLDPPDLVLVGRFGWRVNDLRDMLEGTDYLGQRVHVLHDLSDTDLELLYRACLFTTFPSIIEGWGLPVGESLAHGRPCVASNTSSIPEVGGDLVDYVDPWNVRDGVKVFKKMIFDRGYRESRTRAIADRFVARTWDDVGHDLLGRLKQVASIKAAPYLPPLLAAGELLVPGDLATGKRVPANYWSRPLRLILAESWYPAESFGCWLRGRQGFIWLSTNCDPGTRVVIYAHMLGAPWSADQSVTLQVGRQEKDAANERVFPPSVQTGSSTVQVNTQRGFLCRVTGEVEPDRTVFIRLSVEGAAATAPARNSGDDRIFYVGLIELSYASSNDPQMRVDLLEHFSKVE